jgi:hypothetical protein
LRLEQGKGRPYPTTTRKLAQALSVEPKVLVNCGPPADAGTAD